ncbi:MAG: hypothetical protein LBP76_03875 [Treponema sp.]|nr:hypothetical protein [Treponema sp.]
MSSRKAIVQNSCREYQQAGKKGCGEMETPAGGEAGRASAEVRNGVREGPRGHLLRPRADCRSR